MIKPLTKRSQAAAAKSLTKRFHGETAKTAEAAALKWSKDLTQHGELQVDAIEALKKGNRFIATITYRE